MTVLARVSEEINKQLGILNALVQEDPIDPSIRQTLGTDVRRWRESFRVAGLEDLDEPCIQIQQSLPKSECKVVLRQLKSLRSAVG